MTDRLPQYAPLDRWWVIADSSIRIALKCVEQGTHSAPEAYAVLCEHAEPPEMVEGRTSPHSRMVAYVEGRSLGCIDRSREANWFVAWLYRRQSRRWHRLAVKMAASDD